ncbi:MAG TPA: nuclear transport factor 2 family protein [Acidimicrobiales bacterium]|nr:nuclear transport factor 2 family protein [Acidimicrobiales bacterium]
MTEADEVRALVDATIDGFNRGDAEAYVAMAHARAVTRMAGLNGFARAADVEQMAPEILAMAKRFTVDYAGVEVLGDAAVLWGEFEHVSRAPDGGDGERSSGQFTITCARYDGTWKVVCSHYSAA